MTNDKRDMSGAHDFERDFGALLRRTGDTFLAEDTLRLAEGGMRRGRTRLWRRRAAMATGAVAVAGITVAAVQLPGAGGDDGRPGPVATGAPETESELVNTLVAMLPEGLDISDHSAAGPRRTGDPVVSAVIGEGPETFTVEVAMTRWETTDWRAHVGCPSFGAEGIERCEDDELPDGSVLTVVDRAEEQPEPPDDAGTFRSWEAWRESPTSWGPGVDGLRQLSVTLSADGPAHLGADRVPPLTEEQLVEIARAPVWQRVFDRADAEHGAPGDVLDETTMSDVPAGELRAVFRELVPGRIEVTDGTDDMPGVASLDISDGRSEARVEINAYAAGMFTPDDQPADEPDCERQMLADGTAVYICDVPDGDGDGAGYADVYYPNGASIDIHQTAAPGAAPLLSADELRAIAGAQEWQDLLG